MKTKWLRILSLSLCLLLMAATFAACGTGSSTPSDTSNTGNTGDSSNSSDSSDSSNSSDSENSPPLSDEQITLNIMTLWAKDNTENIASSLRERIAQFQIDYPNVVVVEEGIGDQTSYYTKLKTLAASNDLPDVFISKGSELAMFAQNQVAAPLDDILAADPAWRDGYLDGAFDDLTTNGSVYAIPYSMLSTHVIYYNSKLLSDAGFDTFPQTWSEFLDMIAKLNDNGITPIALGNKEQWVANSCLLSALGDRFTGSDWFYSINDKSGAKFTDPEFVSALAALQELANAGAFNSDMNSINNDQQKTLYYNGTAAMFMEGSWAIGAVVSEAPADIAEVTEVAVLPAVNGGKGNPRAMSGGAGSGLAVGIKGYAEKKDIIAVFLKYVLGEEYSKNISAKGEPAAFKVSGYDTSNVSPLATKYADMAATLAFTPIYDSYLNPTVNTTLNEGLQELLINTITPEALAERIQEEYERN